MNEGTCHAFNARTGLDRHPGFGVEIQVVGDRPRDIEPAERDLGIPCFPHHTPWRR